MLPGQKLSQLTSRAVEAIYSVLEREKPEIILVQGMPLQRSAVHW